MVGVGEQGVLLVRPYRDELLPLWRFRTPALAQASAAALVEKFHEYRRGGDFVGMDMARKFIQMGVTRARRYANRRDSERLGIPLTEKQLADLKAKHSSGAVKLLAQLR